MGVSTRTCINNFYITFKRIYNIYFQFFFSFLYFSVNLPIENPIEIFGNVGSKEAYQEQTKWTFKFGLLPENKVYKYT